MHKTSTKLYVYEFGFWKFLCVTRMDAMGIFWTRYIWYCKLKSVCRRSLQIPLPDFTSSRSPSPPPHPILNFGTSNCLLGNREREYTFSWEDGNNLQLNQDLLFYKHIMLIIRKLLWHYEEDKETQYMLTYCSLILSGIRQNNLFPTIIH